MVDNRSGQSTIVTEQLVTTTKHLIPDNECCPSEQLSGQQLGTAGGRAAAGAMLNAVTALEGLLPLLPGEAVRQQVIRARQVLVQAPLLAEAPSLSAAAAGGPAEETQPSLLVDMLVAPRQHPLATPQLRDRLAALLLQVCHVQCFPDIRASGIWTFLI